MESGVPMLNCLLQHTLRSLCSQSSNSSPKWVYAVFWRILPRNFPPPKWDYSGSVLDRSKGNKRNWILVWEDGYCDLYECEQSGSGYIKGRFGADVFFKMSHEVYSFGEGLVGKVAADNSHKWVFRDPSDEPDPSFISSWNVSIEPQPRAWEVQFKSGIQTIAIISVREGMIQLGSLDKILEDLNLVISIQKKFSYLQNIPGAFVMQRPYLPNNTNTTTNQVSVYEKRQQTSLKRLFSEIPDYSNNDQRHLSSSPPPQPPTAKSINLGWNTPQNATSSSTAALSWHIPPLLPSVTSCSLGALLSKMPPMTSYSIEAGENLQTRDLKPRVCLHNNGNNDSVIKIESLAFQDDQKLNSINPINDEQGEIFPRDQRLLNLN